MEALIEPHYQSSQFKLCLCISYIVPDDWPRETSCCLCCLYCILCGTWLLSASLRRLQRRWHFDAYPPNLAYIYYSLEMRASWMEFWNDHIADLFVLIVSNAEQSAPAQFKKCNKVNDDRRAKNTIKNVLRPINWPQLGRIFYMFRVIRLPVACITFIWFPFVQNSCYKQNGLFLIDLYLHSF